MKNLILFGAGSAGRETLAYLLNQGIKPLGFADNDAKKWGTELCGLGVWSPATWQEQRPDATWVVTIYYDAAKQAREQLRQMGVKQEPLGTYMPFLQPISDEPLDVLEYLCGEKETLGFLFDQKYFRRDRNLDKQMRPAPISELYFPPFIKKIENEVFVDCGAADGDSIQAFLKWQPNPNHIYGFEPDPDNWKNLDHANGRTLFPFAVSDHSGREAFIANGDYSSHIGEGVSSVQCFKLEKFLEKRLVPTFIKMDIEGSELRALWGARRILKEHKPVLAICAYHEPDHIWEIPLLIHAIQPEYELRFRRYAEGARELVWYAIPRERLQGEPTIYRNPSLSMSDDHVG